MLQKGNDESKKHPSLQKIKGKKVLPSGNTHYGKYTLSFSLVPGFHGVDFGRDTALFLEVLYPRFQMTMRGPLGITKLRDLLSQRDRLGRCSDTAFAFRRFIRLSGLRFGGEGSFHS